MVLSRQAATAGGVAIAASGALALYLFQRFKTPNIPTEWRVVGKVANLSIYPLKSGRRIEVQKAECTKRGLMETAKLDSSLGLRDRSFVVYNEVNYEYRTARHYSKMTLIEVQAYDANHVVLSAPDMESLILKVPHKKDHEEVVIKHSRKEEIPSIDCGNEAAIWISRYIVGKNSGLRMGYHDGSYKRTQINKLYKFLIDYYKRGLRNESSGLNSDLAAMHIINMASVHDVNRNLGSSEQINSHYFRPTLVVDDSTLKPFEEDNWEWIKIGDVVMKNVTACLRCILITIDSETGIRREDREPLKTLEKYRTTNSPNKSPVMGILLEVFKTGTISVDDVVYVGKA